MNNFDNLKNIFELSDDDVKMLLLNLYDSLAFNKYLYESFKNTNLDNIANSVDNLSRIVTFFEENEIDKPELKKFLISIPMILLEKNLKVTYDEEVPNGIIIIDKYDKYHPYRLNDTYRCIMEDKTLLNNSSVSAIKK